jgi:hypothetical protein
MSLLSQQDREVVIVALEKYAAEADTAEYYLGSTHHASSQIHALLNWIKLEHYKNEK